MSNASLKEQLQSMVSKPTQARPTQVRPAQPKLKKPKPKWLEHAQYGVELLRAYFPACFRDMADVKPLKIGIKQDLVKFLSTSGSIVTEDKACMVRSLSYYVNTAAYHKSVIVNAARIDLDGNPAGVVTAEEAQYSAERQHAKLNAKQTATPNGQSKHQEK